MTEDNFLTDIELMLKGMLGDVQNIGISREPVPVRVVTPDPDFVELELPSTNHNQERRYHIHNNTNF